MAGFEQFIENGQEEAKKQEVATQPKPQENQPRIDEQLHNQITQSVQKYAAATNPNYQPSVEAYNPYAEGVPQNVVESQQALADISYASQDYANEIQRRIIQDRNGYMTDPNYQGMLNKTYTNQAYDYIKRANNGADDSAWNDPNPEDQLFQMVPDWIQQQDAQRKLKEQYDQETPTQEDMIQQSALAKTTTQAQREIMQAGDIEHGNWNLMSWWDKAKYLLVPGSSATTMDDAPDWAKYIQNIFPSIMASGAGAMVGSLIPVPGAGVAGAILVGGLTYLQGVTEIEIPVINQLLEGLDILSVWFEQGQGAVGAAMSEAKKQLEGKDAGLFDFLTTTADVLKENPYLLEVGKYSYEASADMGFDDILLFVRNTGAKVSDAVFGTDYGQRTIDQISRANIGRSGLDTAIEGTQGYQSLIDTYLPVFTGLVEAAKETGMTEKQAIEFAHQNMEGYLVNYMGTSGMARDLVASSIADPMNLVPYVSSKVAEGVGIKTGDVALQNAGRAAVGNPIIDLLPPGVQQIAEAALSPLDGKKVNGKTLNLHGSQGVDTILKTYANNLSIENVKTLSSVQKQIAGIDNSGKLKDFNPVKQSGKTDPVNRVVDWARRFFSTTNETKMYEMSSMASNFLGSLFFENDNTVQFAQYPELVAELTGKKPIGDKSPLKRFENSAVLNTLREGLRNAPDSVITDIDWDVKQFRQFGMNRDVVNQVSTQLKMTPDEIFNALSDRDKNGKRPKDLKSEDHNSPRQKLMDRLRNENVTFTDANGKTYNAHEILKAMDVFKGDGKRQFSQTYMKANIMEKLIQAIDDYNLQQYGIEPDAWWVRLSDLTKSMQSIALLNFSSSYQVNNFLNNLLTRSVAGVGGIDTDFISTVNQKRGLNFMRSDDNTAYKNTGDTIKNAKQVNDTLNKFDELYNKVSDKKILKGVNNIDIEGMETKAAFDIGCNRYWEATWANNIPEFPREWDALGIDETTKAMIRDIALDSPDAETFSNRMMGEVVIPRTESVFRHMLDNNYEGTAKATISDTFAKMPWLFDMLNDILETNDVDAIKAGFNKLRDEITSDINWKNVLQQGSTFDDIRVNVATGGVATIAGLMDDINDKFNQIWVRQTKQDSTAFLNRLVQKLTPEEFNAKMESLMKIQGGDYNMVRGYAVKYAAAIVEGLGLKSEVSVDIMRNVMQRFDVMTEMINERHQLYLKYGDSNSADYNFQKFRNDSLDMAKKSFDIQLQADIELNDILIKNLEKTLDPSYQGQIDNYKRISNEVIEMKRKLNEKELKNMEKRLDTSGNKRRYKVSRPQEIDTIKDKVAIKSQQNIASNILKSLDNASDTVADTSAMSKPLSLEETLRLEMIIDEAKESTRKQNEFIKNYDKSKNPADVLEPEKYQNTNVNTSFREYGLEEIRKYCEANNIDRAQAEASIQEKFYRGEPVSLGAADVVHAKNVGDMVYNPETKQLEPLKMTDHYEPLNPDLKFDPNDKSRFRVARSKPFQIGDNIVNAGIYENGKLIGYITSGMTETVVVDGVTYPVIGISASNTDATLIYAKDKVWEITPGKPKNADFTMYANEDFHPGLADATPTIQPWGDAYAECSQPIREALDFLEEQALNDIETARTNGSVYGRLTPEQRYAVSQYIDGDMRQAYAAQRYQTQKYGETMVDAALLNYSHRYGFDNLLTAIMPYQFWMTRSVMNWGRRMISSPAWFSMYARLEKLIEKNKKDFLPSRLEGLIGMPMPNMGDGMGDSLYMDINNIVFPFQQFYEASDYYVKNLRNIHNNTLRTIEEFYEKGLPYNGHVITEDEYYQAVNEGRGEVYDMVFADQKEIDETDTSFTGLVGTFLNPNVFVDAIYKHMNGKDKDISQSPMFRLGNLVKATGDNTGIEGITNMLGSALQLPETALRKAAGIEVNPDGNYKDYYTTQYIASMLTMKEISYDDAINAIVEGEGNKVYDEALYRYRQQQAIRMQGGALATEIGQSLGGNKETSVGQLAGSAFASLFGAKIYPEGERRHRELQAEYKQIVQSGDKDAKSKFWKEHPDYTVYNYSYEDDPETRLHKALVDNMSSAYYALPQTQREAVQRAYGDRFVQLFVNTDTRATDYLDDSEIIEWTRGMQGNVPNFTDEQINAPRRTTQQVQWYVDSVQADYDRYKRDFAKKFPGFDTAEEGYYALPESMRKQYLLKNPVVQAGWDYKAKALRANPRLATYMNDRSALYQYNNGQYASITSALKSKLNDWTLGQLNNHIKYGWKINESAERTLKTTYQSLGVNVPYDTWIKSLVN